MTAINSRARVVAIKAESTEGTAAAPAAATDYVAVQDDFDLTPAFDVLENAELRSSIGKAKPIIGAENPTASLSHYLRHSGVEGQSPNYAPLLLAFFGATVVASTQYPTASSSTTTVVKVGSGNGAHFERGQGLLVKDGVNGYSIRALDSVSGDDLALGFKLPAAPASGVSLGKCCLFKPADSGHNSLSVWDYLGNGGAIQLVTGCRVTEFSVDVKAGDLVNGSYSLEGLTFYFNPVIIDAAHKYLDFEDDDGTVAGVVQPGTYKDPHDLAAAIQTAMQAAASGQTYTVTYSNTAGTFTIKGTGTLLTLKWNTGTNTANSIATKIGFSTAADSSGTGATTGYTGTALSYASPYTPSVDAADPIAAKGNELMIGDQADYLSFEASDLKISGTCARKVIEAITAESGRKGSVIGQREWKVTATALLNKNDVDKFKRFRTGQDTKLQWSFGTKTGGNWVAGKCGYVYFPAGTITSWKVNDDDGLATLELEFAPFVDSQGRGEGYLGFV
jgi:hypothetical protein